MRKIGETITKLRTEKGLRQKDLSAILSLSPSSISNYEKDEYWPDLNTICKMADYFNVTTDYILGRTEYRCPPEILDKYVTKDYIVHDIINTLLTLDPDSVNAAVNYVNYLKEKHIKLMEKPAENSSGNVRNASAHTEQPHKASKNTKTTGA
ncbi:MAG TPA: hypothetical protein DCZ91_07545 [Lachnospiraceae bacterium]|nr:hypothetical protein [Lachnospiraceae bacterium]